MHDLKTIIEMNKQSAAYQKRARAMNSSEATPKKRVTLATRLAGVRPGASPALDKLR